MDTKFKKPPESQDLGRSSRGVQKSGPADLLYTISRMPEVREARVREIKESIHSGVYAVDPRKVAESILKNL